MTNVASLLSLADLGIGRLFGTIPEAVIVADVDSGRIVQWNQAAEQLFGYSAAEAVDLPLEALMPDRLKARHAAGFARYRATGRGRLIAAGRPFEVPAVRKDGSERTIELTLSPIEDAPVGGRFVLAIIRDFTDRKAEEEKARRLATIVASSEDAILGISLDGVITDWNPGAERLFGHAAGEVVGQPVSLLIPPERADELPGILSRLRRGERVEHLETERVRKDGSRVEVSVSTSPVRDASGQVIGAASIARDITERKRAEEARLQLAREQAARAEAEEGQKRLEQRVRERTAELEAANTELAAFSYSVSHDLRAPLRAIDGFSQVLLEDYADMLDADGQDALRRVRAASQRMGELIDDLLRLSRVTQAPLRREPVDLGRLAQEVADTLQQSAPERQVEWVVPSGLKAEGDPRLLRGALENLLGNAFKFTGKRDRARIEVGEERADGEVTFFVRDNGAGFDMAYAERLFGAFQRLHGQEEFEGTGVGLATVQRIIRRHGGRVWAHSAGPDQGATFYFTLPSGPAPASPPQAEEGAA